LSHGPNVGGVDVAAQLGVVGIEFKAAELILLNNTSIVTAQSQGGSGGTSQFQLNSGNGSKDKA
jgi:hypothetical protein